MNGLAWLHEPQACVELVTRLAGLSVAVSALEWWVARRAFADDAVLGWPLLRQRSRLRGDGGVVRSLDTLFGAQGFAALPAVTIILAAATWHCCWP